MAVSSSSEHHKSSCFEERWREEARVASRFLVLLDRDGVINEDVGAPGVLHPSQIKLTPGAGRAVGELRRRFCGGDKSQSCRIAMVTNQSCVGKGLITEDELGLVQKKIQALLLEEDSEAKIDRIYQCTSTKEKGDPRMKPMPGMIFESLEDFGVVSNHRDSNCCCCFVGDTSTDLQAAAAAGISNRILVATGYGSGLMEGWDESFPSVIDTPEEYPRIAPEAFPFLYCANLAQAVDWLLEF